jgi:hypothetical protein
MRILEISQREQAKVLQSLVMNMRNGGHPRQDMVSDDEIMKHVQMQMQMQMQQGGAGAGAGAGGPSDQSRHPNDLIDVSDDEDEDDESESSSDSEDDDTDSSSSGDENDETRESTTKKIIFNNNNGTLDTHLHAIEHLTGDDIKVIELTEPLYPVGGGNVSGTKDLNHHDTNDVSDDDDDNDDDNEDMSDDDNDDEETSDDTEVKVEELPSHEPEQHLETSATDIDTTEIKTIFKADKQQQQQYTDYNSMNVQTLKQHLKTKLTAEGMHYNETAINKLNKKELIKHLTQG